MSEVSSRGRLRVLIDGRTMTDRFPGIGRATFNLARALAQTSDGDDLSLLVGSRSANSRHDLSLLEETGACRLVPTSVPRSYPFEFTRLPSLVRRLGPHVFHAPFFLRPYRLGCPCVVTVYDLIPLHRVSRAAPLVDRLVFRFGARLACRRSQAILVPSQATADAVRRWIPEVSDKLVVAPLAADPRFSPRPRREVLPVLRRLDLDRPYVLHLARREPHKNTSGLLAAWTLYRDRIAPRQPGADLVVAGDAPAGMATGAGVRRLGPVAESDLPALYSGAELFVSPSLLEGFGLTVLEAMACGAPVLCGDGGSLREVTGRAVHRVDPSDPEAMASALQLLREREDRRRELASKSLERAARFSWEITAAIVRSTYRKAAAR